MAAQFRNRVRRVAAAAVLCLTASGVMATAQENSTPPAPQADQQGPMHGGQHGRGDGERQIEMMTKRLDLTPDQVTQVRAIHVDSMAQTKALHEDTSMSQSDRHSKMMSVRLATEAKVRAVLNDEQKTKFDAMRAHQHEHMQRGEGQAPLPPPPA